MTGTISSGSKSSRGRRIWRCIWKTALGFFLFTLLWVIAYKWINPPTTFLQMTSTCPAGYTFHKKWIDGDKISSHMKLAVVASEDNNFMKHGGIDWGAVEKARDYNATIGKKKGKYRGASTITQQTAKNVFLWPGTSKWTKWIRKGFEVYFTYLIEWIWGKDRIMEVYLNVIEMGPCKFGIGAAAEDYFGEDPGSLSRDQAALIAACLPNPKKYSVSKPGAYMIKRRGQIANLMRMIGDDYFKQYNKGIAKEERARKEQELEKRLKSIPAEDLPMSVEKDEAPDIPDTSDDEEVLKSKNESETIELESEKDSVPG